MTTQQKLIDSARYLIQTRGYNGFSYADVAEQVQVRKASIHHHFPAKADLALAVVEESRAGILAQAQLLAAGDFDPVQMLKFYVGYWEKCITDATAPFCVAGMLEGIGRQTIQDASARTGIGSVMLLFWLAYYYLPRRKGAGDALAVP